MLVLTKVAIQESGNQLGDNSKYTVLCFIIQFLSSATIVDGLSEIAMTNEAWL
jgi:hypothetical protein